MIDHDIHRLDERELDRSLSRLESDIWKGVAARARRRAAARRINSFQGLIMIVAMLGSVAAGLDMVRPASEPDSTAFFTLGIELLPSTLLLGEHP